MSEQSTLGEKREEAAKVLREILERMCIDAEVSAFDDGERIILDAHGSESALVIGKKGEDIDAVTKGALQGALILYLDFINLFLMLLRVLGGRRRD